MIRTERCLPLLLAALACGPKGPPPPPPIPARFCADGLPLHSALAIRAVHSRTGLVAGGPNPTVVLADGMLGPAVDAAVAGAGVQVVQADGVTLVGAASTAPQPLDLGEKRANLELVQVSLVQLAELLANFSGRTVTVEGGDVAVTLVLQQATAGEALAAVAAVTGVSIAGSGAGVVLTVPAGAAPPEEGEWGAPWRLSAWTGGDRPLAWLLGPTGYPSGIPEKGRVPVPAGDLVALTPEAGTFHRWDREPTVVPLCGVVPRGEGLWESRSIPQATIDFKRLTADDLLWTILSGPLDGREHREIGLLLQSGGPRAEVRARVALDETVGTPLPGAVESLKGVFVGDADGDGGEELLVVGDWITGVGPQGVVPFRATLVIDVGPERLTVEARDDLADHRTAAALSAALGVPVTKAPGEPGPKAPTSATSP